MEREKLIKGLVSIAVIILLCTAGSRLLFKSGETLQDYGQKNPEMAYEPLNEEIKAKITGVSYPAVRKDAASNGDVTVSDNSSRPETAITYEDLRYVHILHYDFNGEAVEGELICNALIDRKSTPDRRISCGRRLVYGKQQYFVF